MELMPKLLAAADMCEAGEEVNLDELAFLLRYAADELAARPQAVEERDELLDAWRTRLLARCDLLHRPAADRETARSGDLKQLHELEQRLDTELRRRYPSESVLPPDPDRGGGRERFPAESFRSGV